MKKKLPIIFLLAWTILTLTAASCNNNNTASTNNTIYVDVNGDNSGCTVISFLDGSRPVTMTNDGTFANYTAITNGSHSVSVYALDIHQGSSCTITINNNTHNMSAYDPCVSSPLPSFYTTCN